MADHYRLKWYSLQSRPPEANKRQEATTFKSVGSAFWELFSVGGAGCFVFP